MRRDPWLDNVKMVLVTLVVIGHATGLALTSDRNGQVYTWLYFFHIPAFVLISGHLSRSFAWDRKHLSSLVTTIALPYLMFEPALYFFRVSLDQHEDGPLWIEPHWAMWYLCVLFFWRLATPLLRHRAALPLSVAVSLLGGMIDTDLLMFPRIVGLLPFFVLGLHLERRHLELVRDRFPRRLAAGVLAAIFVFAAYIDEFARAAFLYYDAGYGDLGYPSGEGMQVRAVVLAIGLLGAVSVMSLVPRGRSWFTTLGSATLVVYLFHGFAIKYVDHAGWLDVGESQPTLALALVVIGGTALSVLLASPPVSQRLGVLVDPVGAWQKRALAKQLDDRTPAAEPAERDRSLVDSGAR